MIFLTSDLEFSSWTNHLACFFLNNKPWIIFFEPVFFEPSTLDVFWPAWRPGVNDQPCLPYLFGGQPKAQWEWSTLPAFFFLDRQKAQCERSTLHACFFLTINLACFFSTINLGLFFLNQFFLNHQPWIFFGLHEGPVWTINLACLICLGANRRPSEHDQPCLPYFFCADRRPSENDQPCLPYFFCADRRPSENDQPCLPYFFLGRQKAQCERSTWPALIFFWTDRRPNVNNEPCIFLTINLACFFKQSTLHVFLHNQPCMFF